MKREKFKSELPGGFLILHHRILDSEIFNSLSVYSQIIYIKALSKSNRATKHNGLFTLTMADFKNGGIKQRTFWRHIKELTKKGLLEKVEHGGMYRNANKYKLTPLRNIFMNNQDKHWGIDTI